MQQRLRIVSRYNRGDHGLEEGHAEVVGVALRNKKPVLCCFFCYIGSIC